MALLRTICSGVIFVLSLLALLACATGIVGAWITKGTVDEASLAAIDLVSG
jgi:Na+-transporting methylmalonyl-CoA/oxaloacetate decarboxylase gamma subunit